MEEKKDSSRYEMKRPKYHLEVIVNLQYTMKCLETEASYLTYASEIKE
jgi:uncharacterized protein YqiB (DUF1249 family)